MDFEEAGSEEEAALSLARLADEMYERGDLDFALRLLDQAMQRKPGDADLVRRHTRLLVEAERFAEAAAEADQVLQRDPDDVALLLHRGTARVGLGDFRAALRDFEHLSNLLPGNANMEVNCAEMHLWLGELDAAQRGFSQALMLDDANVAALFGMARTRAMQRRCGEAREWLRRLVALKNPTAGRLLAQIGEDPCFAWCR